MKHPNVVPSSLERLSDRVARRTRLRLWVDDVARWTLGLAVAVAGAVLVARSVFGVDIGGAWLLSACWFGAWAFTWWRSGRSAMNRSDAALWLDLRSDSSGRVVTAAEVTEASAQAWRAEAVSIASQAEAVPSPRWGRVALAAALGLALMLAATFAPKRTQGAGQGEGIAVVFEERLDDVAEQLEALDENVGLEEEERAELEASLDRLEEAILDDPDLEATYEAIDRLEDQLAERAEEALAEAKDALASLAEQRRTSGASSTSEAGAPSAEGTPRSANLDALLAELAPLESELPDADLSPDALSELAKFAAGDLSKLSSEELGELSEALASAMSEPLSALAQAGLLTESAASVSAFKSAADLPELTAEQLAMLEPASEICPDCGQPRCEECEATGEP